MVNNTFIKLLAALIGLIFWFSVAYGDYRDSQLNSLVSKPEIYTARTISENDKALLDPYKPDTTTYNGKTVAWNLVELNELAIDGLKIYAAAYLPSINVDVAGVGVLLIKKGDNLIYTQTGDESVPSLSHKPLPALIGIKTDGGKVILLRTFRGTTQESTLTTLSLSGKIVSKLHSTARNEFQFNDIEHGTVEVSGFGIYLDGHREEAGLGPADPISRAKERAIAAELGVRTLSASLGPGATGLYQIYLIGRTGSIDRIRGARWKLLYAEEAERLLPSLEQLAKQPNRERIVGATVAFFGVLEGIGDEGLARSLYLKLPPEIRSQARLTAIARYWELKGYPGLLSYSWIMNN